MKVFRCTKSDITLVCCVFRFTHIFSLMQAGTLPGNFLKNSLRIEQSFLWELMGIREEEFYQYVKFRSKLSRIGIHEKSS